MKKKFSTKWKGSKRPGKKRKYAAEAPLHLKRKFLSVNLSKELRKKYGKRNLVIRKNDVVKIMRGKFKGQKGKVLKIKIKKQRVEVENIQAKKQDGSKVNIPLKASNLQIIELYLEDKKRSLKIKGENIEKLPQKETNKKTVKKQTNKPNKLGGKK